MEIAAFLYTNLRIIPPKVFGGITLYLLTLYPVPLGIKTLPFRAISKPSTGGLFASRKQPAKAIVDDVIKKSPLISSRALTGSIP